MKERIVAGFLAALMLSMPACLAATAFKDYPAFLGVDGALDAYVVVGANAATSDVVGAIDLALRLAELSYTEKTVPGVAAAITGIEKKTVPLYTYGQNDLGVFPAYIRTIHYSGLKDSVFSWKGNDYDFYEQVDLGTIYMSHDFATDKINGTEKLVVPPAEIVYEFVFDKDLNITATTGKGSLTNPEYAYPIKIELLGKQFIIVGVGDESVKMLAGSVGTATPTVPVVYDKYSVYSDVGGADWARVIVKDEAENTVAIKLVKEGESVEIPEVKLTIKLTDVMVLQDGTVVGADLVVGPTGQVEKVYTTSCDITSTGTEDKKFPGETEWCIQVASGSFDKSGAIEKGEKIQVVYKPTDTKYFVAGDKIPLPNNYGEIGFIGFSTDKFVEIKVEPFSEKTVYDLSNPTKSLGTWSGFEIAADVGGSILDDDGTGYTKAYFIFNKSHVGAAFYDSVKQKILLEIDSAHQAKLIGTTGDFEFTFNISYSGATPTLEQHLLYIKVNASKPNIIENFELIDANYNTVVVMDYRNKTLWTSTSLPTFQLYDSTSAQDDDVLAATSGDNTANDKIGKASQDVVTDSGAIVVSPASHSGSQRVVVKVPAEKVYVHAYVGKRGEVTTAEQKYKVMKGITTPVAVLDTEVTSVHKAKNLVTVGGPCINRITAEALGLTYPACGVASTIPENAALIQIVDDAFTTGKKVVVVAGWEASNTRTACAVLQQYETLLAGRTESKLKVTSATSAGIVPI
ncbi:MAG: S-layer protein [Candidatus Aenigmatarchaeota archaeon]